MQVKAMATELSAIALGEKYELPSFLKEIKSDTTVLDAYIGKYSRIGQPDDIFIIAREGERMMLQGTNHSYSFDIFPEAKEQFFAKWGEYFLSFIRNEKGIVTNVLIRNEGEVNNWKKEQGINKN